MIDAPHANRNGGLFVPFYADMPEHPKIRKLARTLSIDRDRACLYVLRLHHWAQKYSRQGDTTGEDAAADIAEFVNWQGDPGELLTAMSAARFIGPDGFLHDWAEYGGRVFAIRAENNRRKAESRANRKGTSPGSHSDSAMTAQGSHAEVTGTSPHKKRKEETRQEKTRQEEKKRDESREEESRPTETRAEQSRGLHPRVTSQESQTEPVREGVVSVSSSEEATIPIGNGQPGASPNGWVAENVNDESFGVSNPIAPWENPVCENWPDAAAFWQERDGQRERQFFAAWSAHPEPGEESAARHAWQDAIGDAIDFPGSPNAQAIFRELAAAANHPGDFAIHLSLIGDWLRGCGDEDEPHFSERESPFGTVLA